MRGVVLIGFKGVGKSHFGRLLAKELMLPFIDTDILLGGEVAKRYKEWGEKKFRDQERDVIASLKGGPSVIAAGGGAILEEENARHLKKLGVMVYLCLPKKEVRARLHPLPSFLMDEHDFERMFAIREPLYEKWGEKRLLLEGKSEKEVLESLRRIVDGK